MKIYRDLDKLPEGRADESITEGCLVLEGGAWRGLYTLGVLDALMEENINFRKTVGISAGALSGIGYVSGQIGWSARIDLSYRHDPNYCGVKALGSDHGITGFSYLFHDILKEHPLDKKRLKTTQRRLAVGATNMLTGQIEYFEKVNCNFFRAVRASATVPYISRPVVIGGIPYLDGGCSVNIPYDWAKQQGDLYFEGNRMGVDAALLTDREGNGLLIVMNQGNVNFEQTDRGIVVSVNAAVAGQGPKFARTAFPVTAREVGTVSTDFYVYSVNAADMPSILRTLFAQPQTVPAPFSPFLTQYDTYLMRFDDIAD